MPLILTRRRFLAGLSGIGGAALLRTPCLAAEGPLETTSVRLAKHPGICVAPQHIVVDLLRAEGFTEIRHVPLGMNVPDAIAQGALDFGLNFATVQVTGIDARRRHEGAGRGSCRLLRAFRERRHPRRCGSRWK